MSSTFRYIVLKAIFYSIIAFALCVSAHGEWQALGPFGGPAEAVVVSPGKTKVLLAAAHNALLYRSLDGGAHWTPLAFPEALSLSVRVMRVAAEESVANYFLGGVAASSPSSAALYASRDEGITWNAISTLPARAVYSLAVWEKDSHILVAGCDTGIFLSEDSGANWKRISPAEGELRFVTALAFDPNSRDAIYAGTAHLPWKTEDGGQTWTSIHTGMIDDSDVFSIEVDPAETSRVLASACSGIYLSSNAGASWVKVLGVPNTSRRTYTIRRDPSHPQSLYAGTSQGLWKSANNGTTWSKISSAIVKSIAFDPSEDRFFLATENRGLLFSRDQGKTFQAINDGFVNSNLHSLAESKGELVAASPYDQDGANYLRLSLDGVWSTVKPPAGVKPANLLDISPAGGTSMVGTSSTEGYLTNDGGETWKKIGDGRGRVHAIEPLGPKTFLLATTTGLYRSANAGTLWTPIISDSNIADIYMSRDRIIADAGETLFISEDQANSWTPVASPVGAGELYGIASGANRVVLAATARGAFRSSDAGRSWQRIPDLSDTVRAIAFDSEGTVAVALHDDSVYLSTDAGETWAPIDMSGMEGVSITTLLIPEKEPGKVFAATHARGVFVSSISGSMLQPRATKASAANAADGNTTRSNQPKPR